MNASTFAIEFFKTFYPQESASFSDVTRTLIEHNKMEYASWLALNCPATIHGATWELRLDLILSDYWRSELENKFPESTRAALGK